MTILTSKSAVICRRGERIHRKAMQCNKVRNHYVCPQIDFGFPSPSSPGCELHLWMVLRCFLSEHDGRCRAIIIEIAPSRPFTSFLCSARLQSASVGCVHFDRWRRRRITFCWSEPIFVRNHLHFTNQASQLQCALPEDSVVQGFDIFQKRKYIEESNESLDSAKSTLALATFPIK